MSSVRETATSKFSHTGHTNSLNCPEVVVEAFKLVKEDLVARAFRYLLRDALKYSEKSKLMEAPE